MSYRIFTISPGSTSTKCAVFEDSKLLFKENISHEPEVLKQFPTVNSQRPFSTSGSWLMFSLNSSLLSSNTAHLVEVEPGLMVKIL